MNTYGGRVRLARRGQRASVLMIVLCVSGILLLSGLSLTWITGNSAFNSRKINEGVVSLAIAEAGIGDMLSRMATNYSHWVRAEITESYAGGEYTVKTTYNTNNFNVTVQSTGTFAGETRSTTVELLGTVETLYDNVLGQFGAIVAGGDIVFKSAAMEINGGIHANGSIIKEVPANPTVNGDCSACGTIDVVPGGGGTTSPGAEAIVVPNFLPSFPSWRSMATNDGVYLSGDQTWSGTDLQPNNGVVYVDGSVEVAGNSSLIGTLVVSGSITINNRFSQSAFDTNWPAMLAGIDINLHNRNNYYGVIFAGNNIDTYNNKDIDGTLIALNNVSVDNRAVVDPLTGYPAYDPWETNGVPPEVIVGGWID